MAITLEAAGLVRQKTRARTRNPLVFYGLKAFFSYWSASKRNADLEIAYFEAGVGGLGDTNGVILADAACTVHAVFVKKTTSATDAYMKLFDNATVDTTTTDQRLVLPLFVASDDQLWVSALGLPMANGVVGTAHTTSEGTTDSLVAGDGFVIWAAA